MTAQAILLFASLSLCGRARAASAPAAYDAKAYPLDDLSKELLTVNGYEIRADGKVWDKIGEAPVLQADMPYLLSRLASAKRLRALLEINNIITRYDAERKLSPEDKEAVRALVRQNWVVFGTVPRNDFRPYFSAEELEALDKIPPRFETMSAMTLTDPSVESVTAAGPAVAAPPPAEAPVVAPAAPAPAVAAPSITAAGPLVAVPSVTAAGSLVAAPAAAVPSSAPAALPPVAAPPIAVAAPPSVPPVPSTSAVVATDLGRLKPWIPPPDFAKSLIVSTSVPVAVSTAGTSVAAATAAVPAAASAPPAPPQPPKAVVVGAPEYEAFIAGGPYNKAGKDVLLLIGKRAPDYCLPLLRRTVVGAVPQIVSDGARTGAELRAGFARNAANPLAPPVVALSPGPAFVEVKRSVFGARDAVLLPETPQAWSELGLARPPLTALSENAAPAATENGEWGSTRVFTDGSRRGSYSATEMAGELLEQLLLLGLSREGLAASPYAARRWARTARLMFYARMKEETQRDDFLDPDRRAELRGWLDHPDESDDLTVALWSGSRRHVIDPRRGPPATALEF